jgi:predicted RNA-binding protein with PIN domain
VKVFYARHGSDADGRIIEIVERERNRHEFTVVTSDRSLAARVRACGVRVMRSGEFRRLLEEAPARTDDPPEPTVRDEEMSEWLRYFGVAPGDEDD